MKQIEKTNKSGKKLLTLFLEQLYYLCKPMKGRKQVYDFQRVCDGGMQAETVLDNMGPRGL